MRYTVDQLSVLVGGTITGSILVKVTDDGRLAQVSRHNDADYPALVVQFPDSGETVLCVIKQDDEGNGPGAVDVESWEPPKPTDWRGHGEGKCATCSKVLDLDQNDVCEWCDREALQTSAP